jgi:hypothetical protein
MFTRDARLIIGLSSAVCLTVGVILAPLEPAAFVLAGVIGFGYLAST